MSHPTYDRSQRETLLELAHRSIECGLSHGSPATVVASDYPRELAKHRACFVTLHLGGDLRGCIGSVERVRPLVVDVADRAFAAANKDPRFSPLETHEFETIDIEISVLSPLEPLSLESEKELLEKLRPGVDGLILQDEGSRGVFLPAVWESLPDPAEFVEQLRKKARLPSDFWSSALQVWTFRTETFGSR